MIRGVEGPTRDRQLAVRMSSLNDTKTQRTVKKIFSSFHPPHSAKAGLEWEYVLLGRSWLPRYSLVVELCSDGRTRASALRGFSGGYNSLKPILT